MFWQIYVHHQGNEPEICRTKLGRWSYPKFATSICFKLVEISKSRHVGAEGNNRSSQCGWNQSAPFLWLWFRNRVPCFRTIFLFKQNSVSYELHVDNGNSISKSGSRSIKILYSPGKELLFESVWLTMTKRFPRDCRVEGTFEFDEEILPRDFIDNGEIGESAMFLCFARDAGNADGGKPWREEADEETRKMFLSPYPHILQAEDWSRRAHVRTCFFWLRSLTLSSFTTLLNCLGPFTCNFH